MTSKVNNCLNNIQAWLFPTVCMLCGDQSRNQRGICDACRADLPSLETACHRCAAPLAVDGVCGRCQQQPPNFDRAVGCFHYISPLDFLIQRLKYSRKYSYARLLGMVMVEELTNRLTELPELIVPVPLHPVRLRERGYNQAMELARFISSQMKIPIDSQSCSRIRMTEAQTHLPANERRNNVKGAFRIDRDIKAGHVAIVDDVMTTGSTVEELSRVLRGAGVSRVDVWVCARASI